VLLDVSIVNVALPSIRTGFADWPCGREPNPKYRSAHLWYNDDATDNFTAYKTLFADVIGGQLHAVPRRIMAAAGVLDGARGGVDIPGKDVGKAKRHLAKYYKKMDDSPPWS